MDFLKRLAAFFDRPFFPWKNLIAAFQIGQFCLTSYLGFRQYKVLCSTTRPKALTAEISQETFDKSQAYGRAKAKFGFISGIFNQALELTGIRRKADR